VLKKKRRGYLKVERKQRAGSTKTTSNINGKNRPYPGKGLKGRKNKEKDKTGNRQRERLAGKEMEGVKLGGKRTGKGG